MLKTHYFSYTIPLPATSMNDRYRNHEFFTGKKNKLDYIQIQQFSEPKLNSENTLISSLSFLWHVDGKKKKELTIAKWKEIIPTLDKITRLKIYAGIDQRMLEVFCNLPNVKHLEVSSSKVTDLSPLNRLKKLKRLELDSFTQLKDISPLTHLKLTHLRIEKSFKIENFNVIGEISTLIGLSINGYRIGPRNLRLKSLKPFEKLQSLRHLDLNATSVIEKDSYRSILELKKLKRFDILVNIPKKLRLNLLENHETLESGFITDWDYSKNEFQEGKNWDFE